jgi:hypothetical protein
MLHTAAKPFVFPVPALAWTMNYIPFEHLLFQTCINDIESITILIYSDQKRKLNLSFLHFCYIWQVFHKKVEQIAFFGDFYSK